MSKNNMYTANQDIRGYMADHSVIQKELARQMGISTCKLNNMLKMELPEKDKEDLIRHIDAISEKKLGDAQEAGSDDHEETTEDEEAKEPELADESISTKFQIGDRVQIPSKSLCVGIVADIWHSIVQDKLLYAVDTEGGNRGLYAEDQLEPAPLPIEYSFNATVENNVAVVCMIATQGDKTRVHARGHAHILRDGAVGKAQAVSYAAKRMFESLDRAQENKIYFK